MNPPTCEGKPPQSILKIFILFISSHEKVPGLRFQMFTLVSFIIPTPVIKASHVEPRSCLSTQRQNLEHRSFMFVLVVCMTSHSWMDRKNPCYLLCVAVTVKLVFKVLAAPPLISKQKKRLHRSQRHIKLLNHFVFYLSFFISFIHVCVCARARECLVLPFLLSFFAASFLFLPLIFIPSHILFIPPLVLTPLSLQWIKKKKEWQIKTRTQSWNQVHKKVAEC